MRSARRPAPGPCIPKANESQKGFLLNHIIAEELPPCEAGAHLSNSDPVTGQAAWFDVRVKVYKADDSEPHATFPQFRTQRRVPGPGRQAWQVAGLLCRDVPSQDGYRVKNVRTQSTQRSAEHAENLEGVDSENSVISAELRDLCVPKREFSL